MASRRELDAAIAAVTATARLTSVAQGRIRAPDQLTKSDDSPATIADFAAQAVVAALLTKMLGPVAMIGEEDANDLAAQPDIAAAVRRLVAIELPDVSDEQVLQWVGVGASGSGRDRYWTLDPIDGTKGFLRGDQYAIALALIEGGTVTLGVLGCPNLAADTNLSGTIMAADAAGSFIVTANGRVPIAVATPQSLAAARVCESVESAHSDHDRSAEVVRRLGIKSEPYRIDSQCKYAIVARGDASIYLRLPTVVGYQEKIWDHAVGKLIVERAGGRVTDIDGQDLDFSHGASLAANTGVIASDGHFHDEILTAIRQTLNR